MSKDVRHQLIQQVACIFAIVEIFTLKDAYCRYTTIQNWSDNVYNLVTKRARL